MKKTEAALIKTLLYAAIFNSALTSYELWRYLIGVAPSYGIFLKALKNLLQQKKIVVYQGFYALRGKYQNSLLKKKRTQEAHKKMQIAQEYANILRIIPWVWYVGVSGALAMGNAPVGDDIDFFIISAPNRLWQTRLFCVLLISLFGKRRLPQSKNVKNKICLNMFMDGAHLALPKKERDLYSAHEVAQLKTLVNKNKSYERFLSFNKWVLQYLPNAFPRSVSHAHLKRTDFVVFEGLMRNMQLWFMRKRLTSEIVTPYVIRFHPQDARGGVLEKYTKSLIKHHMRK